MAVMVGEPVDFCSARNPSAMRAGSDPWPSTTPRLSPVFSPLCLIGYQSRSAVGGLGAGSPMMSASRLSSAWGRLLTPPMFLSPRGFWNQASLTVSVPPAASSRLTSTPASRIRGSSESELRAIAMRLRRSRVVDGVSGTLRLPSAMRDRPLTRSHLVNGGRSVRQGCLNAKLCSSSTSQIGRLRE